MLWRWVVTYRYTAVVVGVTAYLITLSKVLG